jgi:hypothetical protein
MNLFRIHLPRREHVLQLASSAFIPVLTSLGSMQTQYRVAQPEKPSQCTVIGIILSQMFRLFKLHEWTTGEPIAEWESERWCSWSSRQNHGIRCGCRSSKVVILPE